MTPDDQAAFVARSLDVQDESLRLRAAMAAGTHPHPHLIEPLVRRVGVEPDFFVRESLTWAITRQRHDDVLARVRRELVSKNVFARTQALHVLSKLGDARAWPWIEPRFLHDPDDDLARTAWRAAAALAPRPERPALARELCLELGRADRDMRLALTIALLALDEDAKAALVDAGRHHDPDVREHARATDLMRRRPEFTFDAAIEEVRRDEALGSSAPDPE